MPRNHSAHTKASRKYFVEINGEEKGKPKRKKFQNKESALAFAERQEARKLRVRITSFDGKEIYFGQ
ncbi:MAG: hypothetical protein ACREBD_04140 [Blastocatellia bacterium]